jgi:hypothetical protein
LKEMEANKNFNKWLSLGRRILGTFGYTSQLHSRKQETIMTKEAHKFS